VLNCKAPGGCGLLSLTDGWQEEGYHHEEGTARRELTHHNLHPVREVGIVVVRWRGWYTMIVIGCCMMFPMRGTLKILALYCRTESMGGEETITSKIVVQGCGD